MASYRVRIGVGPLREGVAAESVLPAGAAAAERLTPVEAREIELRGGRAQIAVRFVAADDGEARRVADAVHAATQALASVCPPELRCRYGNRWVAVR